MTTTVGIYAGSFAPFHKGHADVLRKSLHIFNKVIVARGKSEKSFIQQFPLEELRKSVEEYAIGVDVVEFDGLLKDFAKQVNADAIIRGLRSGKDLETERDHQYWNEDLGLGIPTVYFICDRNVLHVSSSAIRILSKFR